MQKSCTPILLTFLCAESITDGRLTVSVTNFYIGIPVTEAAVSGWLHLGENEIRESEHGGHVFFIVVIVAWNTDEESWLSLRSIQAGQNQITVIVVAVKQKAIIPVHPCFPRKEADILGLDGQDLAATAIIKRLDLRICVAEEIPEFLGFHMFFWKRKCEIRGGAGGSPGGWS